MGVAYRTGRGRVSYHVTPDIVTHVDVTVQSVGALQLDTAGIRHLTNVKQAANKNKAYVVPVVLTNGAGELASGNIIGE